MIGFLLIDKEKGATSFSCVSAVRKIFDTRKVGFVGTLDPLASGLMLVAVGEATKMISYLEGLDKTYETTVCLGATSTTYDGEGEIKPFKNPVQPTLEQIQQVLTRSFRGEQMQTPPLYSAIQVEGRRAYDLARKGEKIVLKQRKVVFREVEILNYEWPSLQIRLSVSSGTYVRSFAYDIGAILGCGGYVESLKRTHIADFALENALTLEEVRKRGMNALIPIEEIFESWEKVELNVSQLDKLNYGGFIQHKVGGEGPYLAMFEGQCTGVLEKRGNELKYRRKFLLQEDKA